MAVAKLLLPIQLESNLECLQRGLTSSSLQLGTGHAGAGFKPKVRCSSFKSSSLFAVVSQVSCDWDFMCSAITALMTFKSSQQTLFTSKGIFSPSVRYSRGIQGHFTFETLLEKFECADYCQ